MGKSRGRGGEKDTSEQRQRRVLLGGLAFQMGYSALAATIIGLGWVQDTNKQVCVG